MYPPQVPTFDAADPVPGRGGYPDAVTDIIGSAEALQSVLSASGVGVWQVDLGTESVIADPVASQIFGFSTADSTSVAGLPLHPEDRRCVTERLASIWASETAQHLEFRIVQGGRDTRWLRATVQRVAAASGHRQLAGIVTDISQHKEGEEAPTSAENAAERRAAALEVILDCSTDRIIAVDHDWRCTYASAQARVEFADGRDITGQDYWSVIGRPVSDAFHECHEQSMLARVPLSIAERSELPASWDAVTLQPIPDGLAIFFHPLANERHAAKPLVKLRDTLRQLCELGEAEREVSRVISEQLRAACVVWWEGFSDADPPLLGGDVAGAYCEIGFHNLPAQSPDLAAALRAGQVVTFQPPAGLSRQEEQSAGQPAHENGSCIGIPILKDARLVAVLAVSLPGMPDLSAAETRLMREIAERSWPYVERLRAEARLRESERRLTMALDAAKMGTFDWDLRTDLIRSDSRAAELCGLLPGMALLTAADAAKLIHPDDRPQLAAAAKEAATKGGDWHAEYRLIRPRDGAVVWVEERGRAIVDPHTGQVRVRGLKWDASKRKHAELTQRILVEELQHRTRNLLAVVTGMTRAIERTSNSTEELSSKLHMRLAALGRVQRILSQGPGHSATVRDLVGNELQAHGVDPDDRRVAIDGANIQLPSQVVQPLSLALHEFATNALKHGALSQDRSKLAVTWTVSKTAGQHILRLRWRESKVQLPPTSFTTRGFGRQLIEDALPYELRGTTVWRLYKDGVLCELKVPIEQREA